MLDKAIKHGKEHRKPYRNSKAVDKSCRNHGSDDWAKRNRLHQRETAEDKADEKIKEYLEGEDEWETQKE